MDKALFSGMVKELLLRDGEVELPGLGLLHTVICPASFSDRGFTLNPPYKKIVFSADEVKNSGGFAAEKPSELASLYAAANNIPTQRAIIAMGETLVGLKLSVTPSQDYDLPGLGRFRRMMDGSLFFVQSQDVAVFPAFDNLSPVSLKSHDNLGEVGEQDVVKVPGAETPAQPSQPEQLSQSEQESQPSQEQTSQPSQEQTSQPSQEQPAMAKKARLGRAVAWTFGTVAIMLALCLVSLAILGRTNPEIVDPLLYTEEQMDVLYARF